MESVPVGVRAMRAMSDRCGCEGATASGWFKQRLIAIFDIAGSDREINDVRINS